MKPITTPVVTPPGLVKPFKPSVMFIGDSITNNGFNSTSNGTNNHGYAFWAKMFSGGRIRTPRSLNFGVGGDTTTLVLDRIAAIKAATADVAVLLIGTNDAGSSIPLEISRANYRRIVQEVQESGKVVVAVTVLPRSYGTDPVFRHVVAMREWILQEMPKMGVIVADPWGDLVDYTRGISGCKADHFIDDLHPNVKGAYKVGKNVWEAIQQLYPRGPSFSKSPIVFNASTNPYGSIAVNPLMTGTGGTISGSCNATVGSVVADNWSMTGSVFTGVTTTFSKVVEDGVEKQVIQFGGTPTAGCYLTVSQTLTLANVVSTQKYKAICTVEIEGPGARTISGVSLELRIVDTATIYYKDGNCYDETVGFPNEGASFVLETEEYTATGTKTEVRARVLITPTIGGDMTGAKVKLSNFQVVRVL